MASPSPSRLIGPRRGINLLLTITIAASSYAAFPLSPAYANGEKLYGVHWWDYNNNGTQIGSGPDGGWSTETVLTHSDPWWQAWFFSPLYQSLATQHDAGVITRVDYKWEQTVPAPNNPDRAGWAGNVLGVAGVLGDWSHAWIVGNEPNLIGAGDGWLDNRITPAGYAAVYNEVRSAIKAARPQDEVLVAGPSPGGVVNGVRWMAGNDWLSQTLAAINAIPGGGVDGVALHAYGNPFTSANIALQEFHADYTSQLAVIDSHNLQNASVYLTEWNRATSLTGNLAANEQVTADFIRGALADVNAWNQTPGRHNIVAMSWFVLNGNDGAWPQYSLEHWKGLGNPVGHSGDLWTAILEGAQYPAGIKGTRPFPAAAVGDFNADGATDGADLLAWQRNAGARGGAPVGDANADGTVNAADLAVWRNHFGERSASALKVPEPATLALSSWIGAAIIFFRRAAPTALRGYAGASEIDAAVSRDSS
jgi:hypothetical protein